MTPKDKFIMLALIGVGFVLEVTTPVLPDEWVPLVVLAYKIITG